jgi:GNAT superfamily N-acetyltransferase
VSHRPPPRGRLLRARRSPVADTADREPVRIRPAQRDDLPALAMLMASTPLLARYGTTRRSALAALRRGRATGDRLLVAAGPDGRLVGLAWVLLSRILTGAAYLRLLLVAEGHQGTGAGARLLGAVEAATRRRANHLVLLATTDNLGARRFYERHGYRHVGDLPGLARVGLDEALYWKPLRPHGRRLPV